MDLRGAPFDELRDRVGAKAPTPGGGAVVGACAALASSLACMVTRYSQGRKGQEANEPAFGDAFDAFSKASDLFVQLAQEDMQAYARLNEVMARPKDDPDRARAMPGAVRGAVTPPLGVMGLCVALLRRYESLAPIANKWLLSDLAIATELTASAGLGAAHLVRANASLLAAHAPDDPSLTEADRIARELGDLRSSILGLCAERSN